MSKKEFCIIICSECGKRVRYYFDSFSEKALFELDRSNNLPCDLICEDCCKKETSKV